MTDELLDDRDVIPTSEINDIWVNAFSIVGEPSDQTYLEVGKMVLRHLKQQDGYPKRAYFKVVAS